MTQIPLIHSQPASGLDVEAPGDRASTASPRDVTKRHILTVGL
ncbi:MAG: hypothetical protein O3C17_19325 [Planctomycetota bacterium]|nr:hypothetical protein [Planctomycetota bacterium]